MSHHHINPSNLFLSVPQMHILIACCVPLLATITLSHPLVVTATLNCPFHFLYMFLYYY